MCSAFQGAYFLVAVVVVVVVRGWKGAVFASTDAAFTLATLTAFHNTSLGAERKVTLGETLFAGAHVALAFATLAAFEHASFITCRFIALLFILAVLAGAKITFTLTTFAAFEHASFVACGFDALRWLEQNLRITIAILAGANVAFTLTTFAACEHAFFAACGFVAIVGIVTAKVFGMLGRLVLGNLNLDKGVTFLESYVK